MEVLEDRPCKLCKKVYTPKVDWQKYCTKDCHDAYWKGVYRDKADLNKRLEAIEEKLNIK